MGGIVGLTIRADAERVYRGSCHTNVLPEGLWAAPFYIDLNTSREHSWTWLQGILNHRRKNPRVEAIWGGHNMLAPIEYGLVVIDYVTKTLISAQGYSSPNQIVRFESDDAKVEKYDALEKAGLLGDDAPWPLEHKSKYIKLPFDETIISDVHVIGAPLQAWCERNFGLSDAERAAWAEYIKQREE